MSTVESEMTFRVVDATGYKVELGNVLIPRDAGIPDSLHISTRDEERVDAEEQWDDSNLTRCRTLHVDTIKTLLDRGDIEPCEPDGDKTPASDTDAPAEAEPGSDSESVATSTQPTPPTSAMVEPPTPTDEPATAESPTDDPHTSSEDPEDSIEVSTEPTDESDTCDTEVTDTPTTDGGGLVPSVDPEPATEGEQILTAGDTATETPADDTADTTPDTPRTGEGFATDAEFIDADEETSDEGRDGPVVDETMFDATEPADGADADNGEDTDEPTNHGTDIIVGS